MFWMNHGSNRQFSLLHASILILCAICIFVHFYADEFGYQPETAAKNNESVNMDNRDVVDHGNDQFVLYSIIESPNPDRSLSTGIAKLFITHRATVTPIFSPPRTLI